jgi:hypothetical protein
MPTLALIYLKWLEPVLTLGAGVYAMVQPRDVLVQMLPPSAAQREVPTGGPGLHALEYSVRLYALVLILLAIVEHLMFRVRAETRSKKALLVGMVVGDILHSLQSWAGPGSAGRTLCRWPTCPPSTRCTGSAWLRTTTAGSQQRCVFSSSQRPSRPELRFCSILGDWGQDRRTTLQPGALTPPQAACAPVAAGYPCRGGARRAGGGKVRSVEGLSR